MPLFHRAGSGLTLLAPHPEHPLAPQRAALAQLQHQGLLRDIQLIRTPQADAFLVELPGD